MTSSSPEEWDSNVTDSQSLTSNSEYLGSHQSHTDFNYTAFCITLKLWNSRTLHGTCYWDIGTWCILYQYWIKIACTHVIWRCVYHSDLKVQMPSWLPMVTSTADCTARAWQSTRQSKQGSAANFNKPSFGSLIDFPSSTDLLTATRHTQLWDGYIGSGTGIAPKSKDRNLRNCRNSKTWVRAWVRKEWTYGHSSHMSMQVYANILKWFDFDQVLECCIHQIPKNEWHDSTH